MRKCRGKHTTFCIPCEDERLTQPSGHQSLQGFSLILSLPQPRIKLTIRYSHRLTHYTMFTQTTHERRVRNPDFKGENERRDNGWLNLCHNTNSYWSCWHCSWDTHWCISFFDSQLPEILRRAVIIRRVIVWGRRSEWCILIISALGLKPWRLRPVALGF